VNYAAKAKTAERLLAKFGLAATLTRIPVAGYNPVTEASTATAATLTSACKAVRLNYNQPLIDGVIIKPGDSLIYMSAANLTMTPQPGDKLTLDGADWNLEQVQPFKPASVAVFYECQARAL